MLDCNIMYLTVTKDTKTRHKRMKKPANSTKSTLSGSLPSASHLTSLQLGIGYMLLYTATLLIALKVAEETKTGQKKQTALHTPSPLGSHSPENHTLIIKTDPWNVG